MHNRRRTPGWLVLALSCGLAFVDRPTRAQDSIPLRPKVPGRLELTARVRLAEPATNVVTPTEKRLTWEVSETAIIVCDMWDKHWCEDASQRVGVLALKMEQVLTAARSHGVMIIHAPSDTMAFYEGTVQRKRMQLAPLALPPSPIDNWRRLEPDYEGKLPIDDSDGGCDSPPPNKNYRAWSRQHPTLTVLGYDGVTDNGKEVYNFCRQAGIKNLVLMGVHTNMCVLGRSFGIRQMSKVGMNVVLARDLTDAMYDPKDPPYVSHARGVELVVEHIERYWCPSIDSRDLTQVPPASTAKGK